MVLWTILWYYAENYGTSIYEGKNGRLQKTKNYSLNKNHSFQCMMAFNSQCTQCIICMLIIFVCDITFIKCWYCLSDSFALLIFTFFYLKSFFFLLSVTVGLDPFPYAHHSVTDLLTHTSHNNRMS